MLNIVLDRVYNIILDEKPLLNYNVSMSKPKVQNRSTKNDPVLEELPLACADEKAAVEFLEKQRWSDNPACPRCGDMNIYQMLNSKTGERQANFRWRCRGCKEQFTVRIGTVFEDSRIPLRHWCFAFWRASTSKKGVSALEIKRQTGLSYKSALFMMKRIKFAMMAEGTTRGPLDGTVEADETYVGGKPRHIAKGKYIKGTDKQPVVALIQRGGDARVMIVPSVTAKTLNHAVISNVRMSAKLMTDEFPMYRKIGKQYLEHQTVRHCSKEYARGEAHVNSAESFFALLKRGLTGIHHAVSRKHLHYYIASAEFLYNHRHLEDGERVTATIQATEGKRLMYRD